MYARPNLIAVAYAIILFLALTFSLSSTIGSDFAAQKRFTAIMIRLESDNGDFGIYVEC